MQKEEEKQRSRSKWQGWLKLIKSMFKKRNTWSLLCSCLIACSTSREWEKGAINYYYQSKQGNVSVLKGKDGKDNISAKHANTAAAKPNHERQVGYTNVTRGKPVWKAHMQWLVNRESHFWGAVRLHSSTLPGHTHLTCHESCDLGASLWYDSLTHSTDSHNSSIISGTYRVPIFRPNYGSAVHKGQRSVLQWRAGQSIVLEAIHESVDLFDFGNCIFVKLTLRMVCWYLSWGDWAEKGPKIGHFQRSWVIFSLNWLEFHLFF